MLCLFSRVNYDREATDVFHMVHINLLYYSLYSTSDSDLCWFLQLSIDIGTEVKYHNKMLDEMVSFTFGLLSPVIISPGCRDTWKNNILNTIKHPIFVHLVWL